MRKNSGWYGDRYSHGLASRGIRSKAVNKKEDTKYKMYHGTNLDSYKAIQRTGYVYLPYITNDYTDAKDWSKKAVHMFDKVSNKKEDNIPIIIEIEVPREFIKYDCIIDPLLLDERYLGGFEKYDDLVNQFGDETSRWWMDELKNKNVDWIDWTLENVNAFSCNSNISKDWIKKVYISRNYDKQLEHGHWEEY